MFNLLRRTRQRKAQKNASDDEEDTAATAAAAAVATTRTTKAAAESVSESNRDSHSSLRSFSTAHRAHESGSAKMALPARRAVIEELEDFASDDEENQSVKLAKTAAAASNGHSAISWRSDNSIINNMGEGERGPATRPATTVVDEHNDRNVAAVARAGSQNEAAKAKANNADDRLIGSSNCQADRYKRILVPAIDGDAQPEGQQQQQQQQQREQQQHQGIAGTVIDERKTVETVIYRQQSKQSNEQKRLSRLSLGNFALQLGNSNSSSSSSSSSNSNGNGNICDSVAAEESTVPKKRRTLQKSREFLSEIFMARGRNHQRKQQQQQQQHQQQQQQQQQQQHAGKCKDVIASGQATATATATATLAAAAAAAGRPAAAAHLETNSDPATATVSTNSYQMTMSNNSPQNRHNAPVPQSTDKEHGEHTRSHSRSRSNSAGAATRQEQPEQERFPNEESRQRGDAARQHDVSHRAPANGDGDFIQAANVELFTRAGDQQGNATLLQHQRSSSSSISNNNSTNAYYSNSNNSSDILTMGQTSAKPNESSGQSASSSRASTPREFRESVVSESSVPLAPPRQHKQQQQQQQQEVPRITVSDCSFESSPRSSLGGEEIFYDSGINIEELNEAHVETLEDDVFAVDIPTTIYQQANGGGMGRPWTRLTNVKLENVQEEAEDEHEEEDDAIEAEPEPEDDELDEALEMLDCDRAATPNGSRQSASSERSALKSDSNLSSSYADSGIGLGSSGHHDRHSIHHMPLHAPAPPPRSSSQSAATLPLRTPFVRDANSTSTDCDCGEEILLQCDELDVDDADEQHFDERLVCIESISLPDVVVESTTANATTNSTTTTTATANASSGLSAGTGGGGGGDGHLNINIANGAGGNSLGNVHFIPIHIEGSGASSARSRSNSPKYRSLDDSCIGRNSVEIVEDGSVLNTPSPTRDIANRGEAQELKKELQQQKARFGAQLEDAHNNVRNLEAKVGDMQFKIQNLEQELSLKQWNVDRLQGELVAAQKDDEYVRKKLKLLEDEKIHLRHKYSDDEDEFRRKYDALEAQYNELTEKYKQTQALANSLQGQLASARLEVEDWRNEVNKIRAELEEQIRVLKSALEYSEAERKICEDKWQKEFEMLRTHNREREDTLMSDCEWQMRQMQRQCKDKMDKSNYERKQAAAKAEELELELQSRRKEAEQLRICQAQVKSLGGVVSEQERSIQTLMERIENLKGELEMANENLETQIEAVRKIKYQCDNAIYDKERQMIYRIDEVRNEAAAFWENKLYTEMTRLTNELESVYVDERRDALDKLQAEHIEELRALTNRYTANEEELRQEIDELTLNLELKKGDFLELRERSDNALLQTRMHLDRADREYQNAMCREEDRRAELEENLKKEFEAEKQEMEEKFRERLGQVKEEFAKELQLSTQDMVETHRKELETQKAKLQADRDQALQEIVERHRAKMAAAEERMNDVELRHQRNLKDLKAAYDAEKAALDKRDISNANEIEQLHRKCRCLTNLFEEMRMRYERRDPRAEDLREISELRTRCDSQERDLFVLTDRLREMQIQMSELQQNGNATIQRNSSAASKKPPSKTIATSCDVIYEERETPEHDDDDDEDEDQEREEEDSNSSELGQNGQEEEQGEQEPSDTESNHTIEVNGKCSDRINEDDAHMISAV